MAEQELKGDRKKLIKILGRVTRPQKDFFKRMYAKVSPSLSLDDIVMAMSDEQVEAGIRQGERTIENNKAKRKWK